MINKRVKKNLIICFVREYYILFFMLVIGICLVMKNSDIPFFYSTPLILQTMFSKFKITGVGAIVDGVAFSVIASTIFFFVVNYIPEYKRKKESMIILQSVFLDIYGHLDRATLILDYVKKTQKVDKYSDVVFGSDKRYYIRNYHGRDTTYHKEFLDFSKDYDYSIYNIIDLCEILFDLPQYPNIYDNVQKLITTLYLNICNEKNRNHPPGLYTKYGLDRNKKIMDEVMLCLEKYYLFSRSRYENMPDDEISKYLEILNREAKPYYIGTVYKNMCRLN